MTRPKADSDGWLTDPVSRDREVSKAVVSGFRTIISLLRAIRDEQAESRALQVELRETRQEVRDLWEQLSRSQVKTPSHFRTNDYPSCDEDRCSLPEGHLGNHRGSLRDVRAG